MKKLMLLTIFAVAVSLAVSACPPSVQKNAAKTMISDAKAAGAKNNANAKARLDSAESTFATGEKSEKKLKYKDAKAKYEQAYREANDAWKMALPRAEGCNNTCPAGYSLCP
jgi:hypothetical protein